MEHLYALLNEEDRDLTVDIYENLPEGKMNLIRILDPGIHILNEELHIKGLPGLKLQNLEIRIPFFDFVCIKAPEIPNMELMIF